MIRNTEKSSILETHQLRTNQGEPFDFREDNKLQGRNKKNSIKRRIFVNKFLSIKINNTLNTTTTITILTRQTHPVLLFLHTLPSDLNN